MLDTLFGSDIVTNWGIPSLGDEAGYPEEAACVQNAVATRRAEFWTARRCAREALARLGLPPGPIVRGHGGAPVWPPGVVGSISHTHGYCAVAVARCPPLRSVGVDVETVRPLEPGVLDLILLERERAWLDRQPLGRRDEWAVLFFAAKEAFYKCQYPVSGTFLDFRDAEVRFAPATSELEVHVAEAPLPPSVKRLAGRFAVADGRVACGVALSIAGAR
jgi:4'-phosphopantetheinyl transferase EntD